MVNNSALLPPISKEIAGRCQRESSDADSRRAFHSFIRGRCLKGSFQQYPQKGEHIGFPARGFAGGGRTLLAPVRGGAGDNCPLP